MGWTSSMNGGDKNAYIILVRKVVTYKTNEQGG
jgi:hypothetical protein